MITADQAQKLVEEKQLKFMDELAEKIQSYASSGQSKLQIEAILTIEQEQSLAELGYVTHFTNEVFGTYTTISWEK